MIDPFADMGMGQTPALAYQNWKDKRTRRFKPIEPANPPASESVSISPGMLRMLTDEFTDRRIQFRSRWLLRFAVVWCIGAGIGAALHWIASH